MNWIVVVVVVIYKKGGRINQEDFDLNGKLKLISATMRWIQWSGRVRGKELELELTNQWMNESMNESMNQAEQSKMVVK